MECCEGKGKRLKLWNCEDKVKWFRGRQALQDSVIWDDYQSG
jgi:hypothetical protein